ncbi:MAG TPA: tRNA glutamyl-Q(34) synthetase GluQRS [Woeseiaceae bacterium]|nr:tRNA glutamyl-Q(34) synthetase GluQRS [Woeseiaceae bacterium]
MANPAAPRYVGRFAPSPTGALHFGSLMAAVASCLQAKSQNGLWLVRMEDIDPPREPPGADTLILRALEAYGLAWDGRVLYQSTQDQWHRELIDRLVAEGSAYPCGCSRNELAGAARGPLGPIYAGTCRSGSTASRTAIRLRTTDEPVGYEDLLQGPQSQRLESESGDFVIRRRDGLIAYQLAVAADDSAQGITEVMRGIDLMDSTPRQLHLQRLLGFATPQYAHLPVAVDARGRKLSKSTGARAVPIGEPRPVLVRALQALGQATPAGLADGSLDSIWSWAREHWTPAVLVSQRCVPCPLATAENGLSSSGSSSP